MTKWLIILGASVRAAAFSAIRAGFEPYAIDCYADRDLAEACQAVKIGSYPGDFESALAAAPDAPWMYTGGLENHPRLVQRLAKLRSLWGNGGKGLREVRKPECLAQVSRETGVCFPQTSHSFPTGESLSRWLVKRRRSSGGLGIRIVSEAEERPSDRSTFYQKVVEGQSASAIFVAASGRATFLGCSIQLLGGDVGLHDRPFLYAGSIGPLSLHDDELNDLQNLGTLLAERFGLRGLFGVDFVRADNALWLIEVNPRYTASVEVFEQAAGVRFLDFHAAACDGGEVPDQPLADYSLLAGKRVVYAHRDGTITAEFIALVEDLNRGSPPGIADLPRLGDSIAAGQPIATVFAQATSQNVVAAMLSARAAAVEESLG